MPTEGERALSTARKRKGVVQASITHLDSRVAELESKEDLTAADRLAAQHLLQKLNSLEAEFRSYHLTVVDLVEEDAFEGEQAILDEHDDRVSRLVRVQQLVSTVTQAVVAPYVTTGGVRLPKISVPNFDGNVINWRSFWEQFTVSVHDWSNLSPAEKLTYLKHAAKEGPAKHVVEGLSGSGDQYKEAVDCMHKRYDRPCLLHQTHVWAIIDAPSSRTVVAKNCADCITLSTNTFAP